MRLRVVNRVGAAVVAAVIVAVAGAAGWAGRAGAQAAWSVVTTPNPAGAGSDQFVAVSCWTATNCMGVGYLISGEMHTLAEKDSSTGWSITPTVDVSTTANRLSSVSCRTGRFCVAVGQATNPTGPTYYQPLAEQWDGTTWSAMSPVTPAGDAAAFFEGVSCPTTTECVAVGYQEPAAGHDVALAEEWSAGTWSVLTTPEPGGNPTGVFFGVSCPKAADCTAVGSYTYSTSTTATLAESWNGATWTIETTPDPPSTFSDVLLAVSCPTATKCFAVGDYPTGTGQQDTLAETTTPSGTWKIQKTPPNTTENLDETLYAVSCPTTRSCMATGAANGAAIALSFGDGLWSTSAVANPTGSSVSLRGVSCRSAAPCTAAGGYAPPDDAPRTLAESYSN